MFLQKLVAHVYYLFITRITDHVADPQHKYSGPQKSKAHSLKTIELY